MAGVVQSESFVATMRTLSGKVLWSVVMGASTGSHLGLDVGGKRRLRHPLKNDRLTEDERNFEGELILYIKCAWRLETKAAFLCASGVAELDDDDVLELKRLRGATIERIDIFPPSYDCTLHMSNDLVLRIFCDQSEYDEYRGNYSLFVGDECYTVGPRGVLSHSREDVVGGPHPLE